MKYRFIVLERISGSGKSTIAKILAERMGAFLYKAPMPEVFAGIRESVDREACIEARYLFYLAVCYQASKEISELLKKADVVSDRYVLTTFCYFRALSCSLCVDESVYFGMVKPDFVFLIICDPKEALKRARKRGITFTDDEEERLHLQERLLSKYRRYPVIEIDNSFEQEKAVEAILSLVGEAR